MSTAGHRCHIHRLPVIFIISSIHRVVGCPNLRHLEPRVALENLYCAKAVSSASYMACPMPHELAKSESYDMIEGYD